MATQNSSGIVSVSKVYKSRKTILELLSSQNYAIDEYNHFSVNEVNTMLQNKQLDMLLEKKEEDPSTKRKKKIYIRYYLAKTIRPQNIQEMIDDLFNLEEILTKEDTLIIITKDEMNETTTNLLKHIWEQDGIFIIIQNIKRLQYNILNHSLVPTHRILSTDEVNNVKTKYNIMDDSQFPDISRFDPVAQVIGIRPGEVCEIIRQSKSAVTSLYYRICV
jgi:DNA-directed RNA polymerase subunit H|uniref:RNA polymerase subunit H/Rpb5 C-terminal domain-containing protein n=1 Tax=viral metagenome TaxID=1070528 RepID=A0A6C0DAN2_9ZZZZ